MCSIDWLVWLYHFSVIFITKHLLSVFIVSLTITSLPFTCILNKINFHRNLEFSYIEQILRNSSKLIIACKLNCFLLLIPGRFFLYSISVICCWKYLFTCDIAIHFICVESLLLIKTIGFQNLLNLTRKRKSYLWYLSKQV